MTLINFFLFKSLTYLENILNEEINNQKIYYNTVSSFELLKLGNQKMTLFLNRGGNWKSSNRPTP